MENIDEKLKTKLLKLQALAEQGVDGEAVNAKDILDKLLKKHKIDINSLIDEEKVNNYFFKYESKFERELLFRIYTKVKNLYVNEPIKYLKKGKDRKIGFTLTDYEFVEFEILRSAYFKSWKKCVENMEVAFIWKNKLEIKSNKYIGESKPMTPERRKEIENIKNMAMGIDDAEFQRNLIEQKF